MNAPARLLVERLEGFCSEYGVELSDEQIEKLGELDAWIVQWNRSLSLFGYNTDEERVDRFFVEAVHAAMWLPEGGSVLDIGTGGGSPAIPMAICRPDVSWTLLEPNRRKKVFLEEVSKKLSIHELSVVRERYENYVPKKKARAVTTRGVSMNAKGITHLQSWLEVGGQVLLLTGEESKERIASEIGSPWKVVTDVALYPSRKSRLLVLELT
jgi:16S rRNA (guanine527-N7)-methyltransferase